MYCFPKDIHCGYEYQILLGYRDYRIDSGGSDVSCYHISVYKKNDEAFVGT